MPSNLSHSEYRASSFLERFPLAASEQQASVSNLRSPSREFQVPKFNVSPDFAAPQTSLARYGPSSTSHTSDLQPQDCPPRLKRRRNGVYRKSRGICLHRYYTVVLSILLSKSPLVSGTSYLHVMTRLPPWCLCPWIAYLRP
jgi:hypothetical protein